jgi:hypothetical protein
VVFHVYPGGKKRPESAGQRQSLTGTDQVKLIREKVVRTGIVIWSRFA